MFICALCVALGSSTVANAGNSSGDRKAEKTLPAHYLLLVNTAVAFQMNEAKLRQFDKSSYDGIAIAFLHAYDTSAIPAVSSMDAQMKEWQKYTNKDIWPWVFLNRMLGVDPGEKNYHSDQEYFKKIAGFDLDDKQGARSDFLRIWRNSLATARDSGVPGIAFDPEFYNYHHEYDIGEMARLTGKKPSEVAESLQALGAQMADIAEEEYPDAVLWFFLTGFTHPGYKTYFGTPYYPTPTYISMGLLDEIVRKKMRLKVLSGGEGSIAYCHHTLEEMRMSLADRANAFRATLEKYNGILELAGTLTLFSDSAANKVCQSATASSVEELEPYLELLLNSYRYNWLWISASDGGYDAFSPTIAPRFDAVIRHARANAWTKAHENSSY